MPQFHIVIVTSLSFIKLLKEYQNCDFGMKVGPITAVDMLNDGTLQLTIIVNLNIKFRQLISS